MKLTLYYLKGKAESWADEACEELTKKISYFFVCERISLKSKSANREELADKVAAESQVVFKNIKESDLVILFDERGQSFKSSKDFSEELIRQCSKQKARVVFIIGGPYGFSEELRGRANARWSLSALTMNHHVAQVVALEQIYRGLTIWKGLPYHNT